MAQKAKNKKNNKKIVKKPVKKVAAKKTVARKTVAKKPVKKPAPVKKLIKAAAKKPVKLEPKTTSVKADSKIESKKEVVKKVNETTSKHQFKVNEWIIYPSHGVGKITGIEKISIMGQDVVFYELFFEREKLTIKVPAENIQKSGVRKLATKSELEEVLSILRNGTKKTKGMWSRRAQEYETKINSGNIILLAEVLRDLTRDVEDADRSYSERVIYETAIERLASEYAIVFDIDVEKAKEKIIVIAKDKLLSEGRTSAKKDDFDDFDAAEKEIDESEDEDEDEEEEEEDDDFDYDEDDDEKPRKKSRK